MVAIKSELIKERDMSIRKSFNYGWTFFDGEIPQEMPSWKGPAYIQAKTERYRIGPASIHYRDRQDDYGMVKQIYQPRELTCERWINVNLPHDYIISQTPKETNNNALGFFEYHPAWYRKHFTLEEELKGKRITIYFEGVTAGCEIYINGVPMLNYHSGFVPFEVDITDFVRFGAGNENVIAVHITPENFDSWWYAGAGIYRNVWLEVSEKVQVARYGIYVAPKKTDDGWQVPVEVEVSNTDWEDRKATLDLELVAPDGKVVAEFSKEIEIKTRESEKVCFETKLSDVELWDIDNPVLYFARATVHSELGDDTAKTTFGFRTVKFDPNEGFFINGRNIKIKGVCGHGDFGLMGKVVPDNIHRYKVKMMKEMGANAYRCSHYPQAEALMDEFDKQGMVVMDETRWFSSAPDCIEQLRTLVKRDRNHPSVIMWSVGNEEPYFITEQGANIARTLRGEVLKLDKTRAILTANDKKPEICTVYDYSDIVGVNYNLNMFDMLHEKFPDKGIVSTECCATGTTRGWYEDESDEYAYINARDHATSSWFMDRETTWKFVCDRKWLMGAFQWIAFEHRGEATWPRVCSQSGAIDLYMQRKDAFYQNQSHWLETPMIHMLPHWNFPERAGEKIDVWVYTNCDEAELFLNGESLGKKKVEYPLHLEWSVEYIAGKIEVVGYKDGKAVAHDVKETTGRAVALKLRLDNGEDIKANGKDVALFTCYAVDAEGREVPDASAFVRFSCNHFGKIVGTGSDVSDHNPVTLPERQMRAGAITVAVKLGTEEGSLRLLATSDTLESGVISVDITK